MKTKKSNFKTLKGLMKASKYEFTFSNFLTKKMYHNKKGWCEFSISKELELELIEKFISYVGFKLKNYTGDEPYLVMSHNIKYVKPYGIFNRLWINKNNLKVTYCVGQDQNSEFRTIRKIWREALEW